MWTRLNTFMGWPNWSFVGVVIAIPPTMYFYQHVGEDATKYVILAKASLLWILVAGAFIYALAAYLRPKNSIAEKVLKDIAANHRLNDGSLFSIGKHDAAGYIQIHDTWNSWMSGLIKEAGRNDLEPHNFADHFYLYDCSSCQVIEFPKDKVVREAAIGNRFGNGKLIRVMPRD
jgi:hypothetical protein